MFEQIKNIFKECTNGPMKSWSKVGKMMAPILCFNQLLLF